MPRMRSPARVNLIGEHTDYNDGYVMPVATDLEMMCHFKRRNDRTVKVSSKELGNTTFKIGDDRREGSWSDYLKGVALYLSERYDLGGWEGSIDSSIPIGSGLSSSAALEVLSAKIFQHVSSFEITPIELAKICKRAENEFVGVRCGIMDQFIITLGKKGSAIFLDCRSLDYEYVPIPEEMGLLVVDTGGRRELAKSEYEKRRRECEEASKILKKSLRDADKSEVLELPNPLNKRALHVVQENKRVLAARKALIENDLESFGDLLLQSHNSLKDLYEVSSEELDRAVELAKKAGALGARMTGAGFGGCAIAVVDRDSIAKVKRIEEEFKVYECKSVDGASLDR